MPLFLKTVRGVCKFCQQLALSDTLECTKLIKVGIFSLDTLDSYPVHFAIIQVHWRKTYSKPFNASQFPTFRLLIKCLTD